MTIKANYEHQGMGTYKLALPGKDDEFACLGGPSVGDKLTTKRHGEFRVIAATETELTLEPVRYDYGVPPPPLAFTSPVEDFPVPGSLEEVLPPDGRGTPPLEVREEKEDKKHPPPPRTTPRTLSLPRMKEPPPGGVGVTSTAQPQPTTPPAVAPKAKEEDDSEIFTISGKAALTILNPLNKLADKLSGERNMVGCQIAACIFGLPGTIVGAVLGCIAGFFVGLFDAIKNGDPRRILQGIGAFAMAGATWGGILTGTGAIAFVVTGLAQRR